MRLLLLGLALLLAAPAAAQRPDPLQPEGENLATPPGWVVRPDVGHEGATVGADSTADIFFVNMTPGWHVTTGPAAILYHPASTAEGAFRAQTTLYLFDPGDRLEAFGLFVGGQHLDGDAIAYDYFLIRNSGEFLIKRREGETTTEIHPWTPHEAIATFGPETESSVPNTLGVEAGEAEVAFLINGQEVARLPRSAVRTDGVVGLRVNHALNLHVEDFRVSDL